MNTDRLAKLDLNLLVSLQVLLEEKSVTRAAIRLHVTQSAMSKILGRLRRVFDDPLFVRDVQGLSPTMRACALEIELGSLLEGVSRLLEPPLFDPATARHHFRIAAIDSTQQVFLPHYLPMLINRAPGVTLEYFDWQEDSLRSIERGDVDLGMTARDGDERSFVSLAKLPKRIRQVALAKDPLVCLMQGKHPALRDDRWDLEHYLKWGHVQVRCEGHDRWLLDQVLEQQGLQRNIVLTLPDFQAALSAACSSDLIFTTTRSFARYASGQQPLTIRPLPVPLGQTQFVLLWHQRHETDPAHRWLREQIQRGIGDGLQAAMLSQRFSDECG